MANLYHWLNGNNTDRVNSVDLTAYGEAASIANSSRWYGGANPAFRIGHTAGGRAVDYTAYGPVDALENIGTDDFTVMFWWKPNDSSFGTSALRHHFISSPDVVKIANYGPSGNSASSYDLRAYYRYGSGTQTSKSFNIDLTGYPWIRIYFSRIAGVFTYALFDASGNILNDNSGNPCYFVKDSYAGNIYNATNSDPHIRIGGNFAYGKSANGFYDDIIWSQGYGIAYDSIETHADGYHVVNPVINSFSSDVASVDSSGDSVTFSWDSDLGTTLSLYNPNTHETIDVSGLSSKSVAITGTVSYVLIAQNAFGQITSAPVTITLNGGTNMAYISDDANKPGLVLQKKMLDSSGELAAVLKVSEPESGLDTNLNAAFAEASTQRGALSTALSAEVSARISDMSFTIAERQAGDAAVSSQLVTDAGELDDDLAAATLSRSNKDSAQSAAIAAELVTMNAAVASLATARGEGDVALTTDIGDMEDARVAAVAAESAAMLAGDNSVAALLATEESEEDTSLASINADRVAGDAALSTNLAAEEAAMAAEVANKQADRIFEDGVQSAALDAEEAAYVSAIAAEQSAMQSVDVALEGELAVAIADRSAAVSSEKATREADDATNSSGLSSAVLARETAVAAEAGLRAAADAALQGEIDDEAVARAADVSVAVAARSAMDVSLSNELDAAINARITAVDSEESAREADFLSIANLLSDEESNRAAAVSSLATKRAADDATHSAAMSTQAALRSSEMSSEKVSMEAGDDALIANITSEIADRQTGDAAVSTSLKVLTDRLGFSGDGAGGGDFVMTDAGSGVAVTAKFVKVAGTNVVKMFIS